MPLTLWDIDGTIFYNMLDINYQANVAMCGSLANYNNFRHLNPLIRPDDIKYVLTARGIHHRDITEDHLAAAGIDNAIVIMNPESTEDRAQHLAFKANVLNTLGADYYIDDDIAFGHQVQKRASCTRVIDTETYYAFFY